MGIDEDARADALDTLERVGYVDDGRYAAGRAGSLAGRGYGDEAIRHLLGEDGVAAEEVEAALGTLAPEEERAAAIAARDGRTPKVAARLERKGFGADALEAVFGSPFADEAPGA